MRSKRFEQWRKNCCGAMATLAAGDKDEIALQVKDTLANNENISWAELSTKIAEQLGRQLNRKDRKFITGKEGHDLFCLQEAGTQQDKVS